MMIDKAALGLNPQLTFGTVPLDSMWQQDSLDPATEKFSTIYAFGDSLSDVGNDYKLSLGVLPTGAIYSDGRFSNGNVWVQDLAEKLGLSPIKASLLGGTDYAYGGAEAGTETLHSYSPLDLPTQLAQFEVNVPHPEADALYTLSIGANDLLDAIPEYAKNETTALKDITQAVSNEISFLKDMAGLGADNFLILNVPDLGKTPAESGVAATATKLSSLYDQDLSTALKSLSAADTKLDIHVVNAFALIDAAVADPAAYGLKNVTTPVWTGNYENPFSGHLNATGAAQNTYLFFDHLHPTAAGHHAVADAAHTALNTTV